MEEHKMNIKEEYEINIRKEGERENCKTIYEKIKTGARKLVIAYAVLGSLWMLGADTTGHYSADLCLGKAHLSKLEQKIYRPIFEELDIESDLIEQ